MSLTINPSSAEIAGKLAAVDTALADWEAEFDTKVTAAVGGDTEAAAKLAEINANIERAKIERMIFAKAHGKALSAEAEEAARADAEARKEHTAIARLHAGRLIDAARRMDAGIEAFSAMLAEINEAERLVREHLRLAKALPGDAVRGRYGLGQEAVARLLMLTDGRSRFRQDDKQGVEHWSRVGWSFLLADDDRGAAHE